MICTLNLKNIILLVLFSDFINYKYVMIMASEISKMVMETMLTLITTAFAFVAGLAWNEAIQKLIEEFYTAGGAVTGLLIYAVIVTIVAVVVTVLLARIAVKWVLILIKNKYPFLFFLENSFFAFEVIDYFPNSSTVF